MKKVERMNPKVERMNPKVERMNPKVERMNPKVERMSQGRRNEMDDGRRHPVTEVRAAGATTGFGTRADVFSFGCVLWCLATLVRWCKLNSFDPLLERFLFSNCLKCLIKNSFK